MAIGPLCWLEKSCAKSQSWIVEPRLKSAWISTRSRSNHVKQCSVGGIAQ